MQQGSVEEFQLSQAYTSLPAQENWTSSPSRQQETHDNSLTYHQPLGDCELQQHPEAQARSNPIAILRPPQADEMTAETDDEDSVVDVELDAIRLQRKYGAKVVAATYQTRASEPMISRSMLRAPYFGSLSRSENYLSLPPMTLSDAYDEPPADVGSYGSLRDSHQKGRFLDGPASYRDTRTGQLRSLNPRVRYNGVSNSNLSIRERMQQAQQKMNEKKKKETKTETKDHKNTSTLAAMMDQASKEPETATSAETNNGLPLPPGESTAAELNQFGELEVNRFEPPAMMMSTSLTAFEYLLSANKLNKPSGAARSFQPEILEHLVREEQFQPISRSKSDPTPHLRSPRLGTRTATTNHQPPTMQLGTAETLPTNGWSNYAPTINETSSSAMFSTVGAPIGSLDPNKQGIVMLPYGFPTQDHNPDTDGAFDMDE
jgi:hypothetical protein